MENKENFIKKEDKPENPLKKVYILVHNKEPENLSDWQIVQKIVEVLDDQDWVPSDLAKECLYKIVHMDQIEYLYNKWKRDKNL